MDKNFCTDIAGNSFSRMPNSSVYIHIDRRKVYVNIRTYIFDPGPHLFLHDKSVNFTTVMEYNEIMTVIVASYTCSMNWIKEVEYISPDCFMHLVERLLLLTSCWKGFIYTIKSSFIE